MTPCQRRIGLSVRVFLIVSVLAGGCCVCLGFYFDSSPSSPLSLCLIAIGIWTVVAALFGFCGSFGGIYCMRAYLILSALVLLLQAAGMCAVFFALDEFAESMTSGDEERQRSIDFFRKWRWPLAAAVAIEIFPLFLVLVLHCCFDSVFDFEPFQERGKGRRLDLEKVRESIGRSAFDVDSSASTRRLRQKMARKYGHLSHTTNWSDERKWWPFG